MSLKKKIFGSLFILVCAGIITAAVLFFVKPGGGEVDPLEDIVIGELPELPEFDASLTEFTDTLIPSFDLPGIDLEMNANLTAEIGTFEFTMPEVDQTTVDIPSVSIDASDIQGMMSDLLP